MRHAEAYECELAPNLIETALTSAISHSPKASSIAILVSLSRLIRLVADGDQASNHDDKEGH